MSEISDHFAKRSFTYEKCEWANSKIILQSIANCIDQNKGNNYIALDLGAGTGAVSKYILCNCHTPDHFTAVDISAEMLSKIKDPRIVSVIASVTDMPFLDNQFDLIVSRQCLHYVKEIDTAIEEIKRVLSYDGVFILSQFVPFDGESIEYWKKLTKIRQPLRELFYSENNWIEVFQNHGFEVVSSEHYVIMNSVNKWARQYSVCNQKVIENYKSLLINAPEEFKRDYNVTIIDDDIESVTYGVTISFRRNNGI